MVGRLYLGVLGRTSELLIGTSQGVVKARSLRRRPPEERGNRKLLEALQGVPWEPVPGKVGEVQIPVAIYAEPIVGQVTFQDPAGQSRPPYLGRFTYGGGWS